MALYIGSLPHDVRTRDLEDLFTKFGKLKRCDIKGTSDRTFAFVTYEDERDAEDAMEECKNKTILGARINIEWARGSGRYPGGDRRDDRRGPRRSSRYQAIVDNLPSATTWRELKDLVLDVVRSRSVFVNITRDGKGIVGFDSYDDLRRCIRQLDGTRFHGKRLIFEEKTRDRSYSPRRYRSRDRSYSPRRRSPSPRRERSPRSPRRERSPRSPSPRRERSPRSSSPRRERSPRSPSPRRERSPSPRRDERSPSPRRSLSPRRDDRSPSPKKDDRSPSPK